MVSHIAMFSWKNRPTPVGQFSKIFAPDGPSIWRGPSNMGGPSKLGGGLLVLLKDIYCDIAEGSVTAEQSRTCT